MSAEFASLIDLELAWKRAGRDLRDRNFVSSPYEKLIVEHELGSWLSALEASLVNGSYRPSAGVAVDVPKGGGAVRNGLYLNIRDRVVYSACVGACLPAIAHALAWPLERIDFGNIIAPNLSAPAWLLDHVQGWSSFRGRSLARLDRGCDVVAFADISCFYDDIDIGILISDLINVGVPRTVTEQLSSCLNRWTQVQGRGIPQGSSASDILSKLYLNSVDRNLVELEYVFCRYSDDFRLFCRSQAQAREAIVVLNQFFRKRGLSLQTAKLRFLSKEEARGEIDGIAPVIGRVRQELVSEVMRETGLADPYLSIAAIDRLLAGDLRDVPVEVLRQTFRDYFLSDGPAKFDKSLFHFLLNRLAAQGDQFAMEYCAGALVEHPEETKAILGYVHSAGAVADFEDSLADFIKSQDAVYTYQVYEIFDWLYDPGREPSIRLLALARKLAFDPAGPGYLKSTCRRLIASFGSAADMERLESLYPETSGHLERAELVCCLARVEPGRRNSFLARVESDGDLVRRAVRWVKAGGPPERALAGR